MATLRGFEKYGPSTIEGIFVGMRKRSKGVWVKAEDEDLNDTEA